MAVKAAVVVDSRNVFHQAGDAIGLRLNPTVPGVVGALSRFGIDVAAVHVGLALARPEDRTALARYHAQNDAYRSALVAAGGYVLLGELHKKKDGSVQEKIVDGACNVRITRYVEEISSGRTDVEAIVVMSQDIDLKPSVDYAIEKGVPVIVAALDVVQHRAHPSLLFGPGSFSELTDDATYPTGHERRELLVAALVDGARRMWTVGGKPGYPVLTAESGLMAVPATGLRVPAVGTKVELAAVDVNWLEHILGKFPLLVVSDKPPTTTSWTTGTVVRRTAPMTIQISGSHRGGGQKHYPLGGIVPGDTVVVHLATGRVLGRLPSGSQSQRTFDPDTPLCVRVVAPQANGGAVAADRANKRGLLISKQGLRAGQLIPAMQVGAKSKGPVWMAIGTPLPDVRKGRV